MPQPYFYIRSQLSGLVLDIRGGSTEPGAQVIMWSRKDDPSDNQLWYLDSNNVIRSKLNNTALSVSDDNVIVTAEYDLGDEGLQWQFFAGRIHRHDDPEMVLDIRGSDDSKGADVIGYAYHGGMNQRWSLDYVEC